MSRTGVSRRAKDRTNADGSVHKQLPSIFSQRVAKAYRAIKQQSRPAVTDEKCRLLDLPAELRNEIYRLVVVVNETIMVQKIFARDDAGHTVTNVTIKKPNLSFVNRQIRSEASAVFYGENTFGVSFSDGGAAEVLLHNMVRHEEMRAIRRVLVHPWKYAHFLYMDPKSDEWRDMHAADIKKYEEAMERWVQGWWRVKGSKWYFWPDKPECKAWASEAAESGLWNAKIEKQTRELAMKIFRYPLEAKMMENVVWARLAELPQAKAVPAEGRIMRWAF